MKREELSSALDVSLNIIRSDSAGKKPVCCFHDCSGQGCQLSERAGMSFLCSELVVGQAAQNPAYQSPIHETFQCEPFETKKRPPKPTAHNIPNYNSELFCATLTLYKMRQTCARGLRNMTDRHCGPISVRTTHLCRHLPCVTPLSAGWGHPLSLSALPALAGVQSIPHALLWLGQIHGTLVSHTDWSPSSLPARRLNQQTDGFQSWIRFCMFFLCPFSTTFSFSFFFQPPNSVSNNNTDNTSSSGKGTEISSYNVTTFLQITEVS